MISTAIPIGILAVASLASAQSVSTPDTNAVTPSAPIQLQFGSASIPSGGQIIAITAQATTISNGGQSVSTSNGGQTMSVSNGKKSLTFSSKGKDDIFAGTERFAQGARESTEINLDQDTMSMMNQHGRYSDLAKKVKYMTIRTYEYDKPGMYRMEDVEVFRRKLDEPSWTCAVRVRERNESTDICSRLSSDHENREMVIMTTEPQELTFIHMVGQLSMEDLGKAAGSVGKAAGAMGKAAGSVGKAEGEIGKAEGKIH